MARTKNFSPDKVLEKAVDLFWEKGFHATSMQELVNHLEINRASMYDTFGSKQSLFLAALDHYQEKEAKEVSAILYYYTNVRQGLYVLFEYLVDTALKENSSNSCFHVNSITELANTEGEVRESLARARELQLKMYKTYLEYGLNQGQISPQKNSEFLANSLYTFQCGLMTTSKINPNKEVLMQAVSTTLGLLD